MWHGIRRQDNEFVEIASVMGWNGRWPFVSYMHACHTHTLTCKYIYTYVAFGNFVAHTSTSAVIQKVATKECRMKVTIFFYTFFFENKTKEFSKIGLPQLWRPKVSKVKIKCCMRVARCGRVQAFFYFLLFFSFFLTVFMNFSNPKCASVYAIAVRDLQTIFLRFQNQ